MKLNQLHFSLNSNSEYLVHLVRVVAAQAVVIGHGASFFGVFPYIQPPYFFYIQNIGVVIFFFISGFVISYTCHRKNINQVYTFSHFLFDRLFRLLLVLVPVGIIVLGVDTYFSNVVKIDCEYRHSINLFSYFANILFLQDYPIIKIYPSIAVTSLPVTMLGTGRPFWSLAIEFWLYIFYGYIVLVKSKESWLKNFFLFLFILSLPVVVLNCFGGKGNGLALLWFFGVFAMRFLGNSQEILIPKWAMNFALGLALFGSYSIAERNYAGYNFHANVIICAALLLLIIYFHNLKYSIFNQRAKSMILFLASYSFTLYASHYTVLYWLKKILDKEHDHIMLFLVGFALSNIVAIGLAYCFEMNYKALRFKMKNTLIGLQLKYQR